MSIEILRAIIKSDIAKLESLIVAGGNIMEISKNEKWNYLHKALGNITMLPSIEVIQELVNRGVDVNAIDCYGNSPVHYAARSKRADIIKLLFNAGANINIVNLQGVSPLRQLLLSKPYDYESIKILLHAGADVDQKVNGGLSIKEFAQLTASDNEELQSIFNIQ